MKDLFFELIQIAIGNRSELSRTLSDTEWKSVYEMARKHALLGVCFVGCQRLPSEQRPPEILWLQWLGMAAIIQGMNQQLNEKCGELTRMLAHDGLNSVVLKGQSNLINYPEELREARTPGDIDIWCWPLDPYGIEINVGGPDGKESHRELYTGFRGVIEYVLMKHRLAYKGRMPEVQYHHVDLEFQETEVEVHFRPSWMNCPWHNRRLQEWFKNEGEKSGVFSKECIPAGLMGSFGQFYVPSAEFNTVYQLVHIYRHLFNEGVGLRQLLDYYFVLLSSNDNSNKELIQQIERLGMKKFASAVMWVIAQVFDIHNDNDKRTSNRPWMLCEPDEKQGLLLLNEVLLAGNFGRYDERNVISRHEGYLRRFIRRQRRMLRFLRHYPAEVIWGPWFSVKQRIWRELKLWRFE